MIGSRARAVAKALTIAITLVAVSGVASAQRRHEPPGEAVDYYQSGRRHFAAGRYREAVADLQRAREHDPNSPTLVYNLARVYELLGELDAAIESYEEYRRLLPSREREERARVAETVRRLRGARVEV